MIQGAIIPCISRSISLQTYFNYNLSVYNKKDIIMSDAAKKPAARKPAAKKPAAKKPAAKKPAARKPAAKKPAAKKPAARKPAAKKPAAKKPAAKKPAAKKPAAKKPAARKPAAKKPAARKPAAKKAAFSPDKVGNASAQSVKAASAEIDRQMKKLASIDTRVLIAKDKLSELQEHIHHKRLEFQEKNTAAAKRALENARKKMSNHKDLMSSIREKRAEAVKALKESEALHNAYESVADHLEKGRTTAMSEIKKAEESFMKEAKKAEVNLMKKLHSVEEQMLKKANQLKKKFQK